MNNREIKVLLDQKRRANGRVYNGDIKQIGKELGRENCDLSNVQLGLDYEIDFVYFHIFLTRYRKDLNKQLKCIEPYLPYLDSWFKVDNLITYFKKPINFDLFYAFAKIYLSSTNPYVQRLGYVGFIKADLKNIDNCIRIIQLFKNTEEHTLIMAQAWVMAEMYINNPTLMYSFFKTSNLNYPIISMALSKCTDSYRISKDEKIKIRNLRPILKMKKGG